MRDPHTESNSVCLDLPRWPLLLWLLQLVVPTLVLAYGVFRVVNGPPLGTVMWPALGLSVFWTVAVLATVLRHGGRQWFALRRKQLALCFATTVISVALCDLALTLTGLVPTIAAVRSKSFEFRPAVSTVHRLLPKRVLRDAKLHVTINHRGFLGPEIVIPKPKGTVRIIFLGGSQVAGSWPKLTGELLTGMGKTVDIVNAGVFGHRTPDSVGKMLTDLWLLEPDIVVVDQAWNDIKYFSTLEPNVPYRDLVTPAGRDWRIKPSGLDWLCCWSALYRTERKRLVAILIGEEGEKHRPPTGKIGRCGIRQFKLDLQVICDMGKNLGAEVVLCKQARLPTKWSSASDKERIRYGYVGICHDELVRAFAECDRVVDDVAREKHCWSVDMNGPLSGRSALFNDHIHFTDEGGQRAAQLMSDELMRIMK